MIFQLDSQEVIDWSPDIFVTAINEDNEYLRCADKFNITPGAVSFLAGRAKFTLVDSVSGNTIEHIADCCLFCRRQKSYEVLGTVVIFVEDMRAIIVTTLRLHLHLECEKALKSLCFTVSN